MTLLKPDAGLMLWQIFVVLHLLGIIVALVQLYRDKVPTRSNPLWCFIILAIPLGWLVYLVFRTQERSA